MSYHCLLINQKTNERKELVYSNEEELVKIVGDYVVSRARELGQTSTTIINKGTTFKMLINYRPN
jgi:hypothetical protein